MTEEKKEECCGTPEACTNEAITSGACEEGLKTVAKEEAGLAEANTCCDDEKSACDEEELCADIKPAA